MRSMLMGGCESNVLNIIEKWFFIFGEERERMSNVNAQLTMERYGGGVGEENEGNGADEEKNKIKWDFVHRMDL